jgi:branched-chain amino acid transport system ATP-binding protein
LIVREIGEFTLQLKSDGLSVLLVEQNLPMALKISDYVYIVNKGAIIYQSTPEELKNNKEIQKAYLGKKVSSYDHSSL